MIYLDTKGHLITDGPIAELHKFAARIGLKRRWFQKQSSIPHYDLTTEKKRQEALENGAELVSPQELVRKWRVRL